MFRKLLTTLALLLPTSSFAATYTVDVEFQLLAFNADVNRNRQYVQLTQPPANLPAGFCSPTAWPGEYYCDGTVDLLDYRSQTSAGLAALGWHDTISATITFDEALVGMGSVPFYDTSLNGAFEAWDKVSCSGSTVICRAFGGYWDSMNFDGTNFVTEGTLSSDEYTIVSSFGIGFYGDANTQTPTIFVDGVPFFAEQPTYGRTSYTVTSPVPLPAASLMLLSGLGGLTILRRKKKA